jgi:methylated-DNA-[protein]-cysteine S-methyltransferase
MAAIHTTIASPLGDLTVVAEDGRLRGVYFPGHRHLPDRKRRLLELEGAVR